MLRFKSCENIIVDGDEFTSGFLGLDWLPSGAAKSKKVNYESAVIGTLTRLISKFSGWAVIVEIFRTNKKMYVRPFHPTPADQYNAYAQPTDWAAATLKDTAVRDNQGNLPPPGAPRITGTGWGSDTIINFSPSTFAPGSGAPIGPGTSPDEILLHEMVHGLRQMRGRMVREPITSNPGMDNYEEFVAILISNIFRSECGIPSMRADHHGFAPLTGPTTDPAIFKSTYQQWLSYIDVEQPSLCQHLRQARVAFNPLI